MNADQFGNYIAGFEGAAYEESYFWTTGMITAQHNPLGPQAIMHLTRPYENVRCLGTLFIY
jgi:hypothetical protein